MGTGLFQDSLMGHRPQFKKYSHQWERLCCVNGSFSSWVPEGRLLQEDLHLHKDSRKQSSKHKAVYKDRTLSMGGWADPDLATTLRPQGSFPFMWAGSWVTDRVVSNGSCFQSFDRLLPQVGKGSVWCYKVCTGNVTAAFPPGGEGSKTAMQIAFRNFLRGRGERGEHGFCSEVLEATRLRCWGVWEATKSGWCGPRLLRCDVVLLMCNQCIAVLASSSRLTINTML